MFGTILIVIAIIGVLIALHHFIKAYVTHKILKDVNKRQTMKHRRYER